MDATGFVVPRRDSELIPIVQRSYDLCVGLHEHVSRFPRAQRGMIGRVILDDGLRMLTLLAATNRAADRVPGLTEASGRLDALRITLRLSNRLGFLSHGGYERLSAVADEVGRMLGGWIKHGIGLRRSDTTAGGSAAEPIGDPVPPAESASAPQRKPRRSHGVRYTMTSPTIERYLRVKLAHPEAVVFLVVGAFCQTFFEDALYCSKTLRLAVRNLAAESEAEKIPVCGFPRSRFEKFSGLLHDAGRAVHAE